MQQHDTVAKNQGRAAFIKDQANRVAVGWYLRWLRETAHSWSRATLERRAGISQSDIVRIEDGVTFATWPLMVAFVKAVEADWGDIAELMYYRPDSDSEEEMRESSIAEGKRIAKERWNQLGDNRAQQREADPQLASIVEALQANADLRNVIEQLIGVVARR